MDEEKSENWKEIIQHPQLGEVLLQRKKITISQLDEAFMIHESSNLPLGEVLLQKGFISKDDLVELLELQTEIGNMLSESWKELKSSTFNE